MDKTTQLEQRIAELEKQLLELQQASTIPLSVDKSFNGRGFVKFKSPAIFVIGDDQGAWLNAGFPTNYNYPSAFGQITEGEFAGFWIPLYIPPNQVTPGH